MRLSFDAQRVCSVNCMGFCERWKIDLAIHSGLQLWNFVSLLTHRMTRSFGSAVMAALQSRHAECSATLLKHGLSAIHSLACEHELIEGHAANQAQLGDLGACEGVLPQIYALSWICGSLCSRKWAYVIILVHSDKALFIFKIA